MKQPLQKFLDSGDLSSITTYQAGIMQSTAHRVLQKHCDSVLRNYGISKMQWLIIGTVLDAGKQGIRITELAETLGTTLPYLTTTINALESKRILIRRENIHDNRSKLIMVSPTFARQCKEIEHMLWQCLRSTIYAKVDPDDLRTYMKVLVQINQASENKNQG